MSTRRPASRPTPIAKCPWRCWAVVSFQMRRARVFRTIICIFLTPESRRAVCLAHNDPDNASSKSSGNLSPSASSASIKPKTMESSFATRSSSGSPSTSSESSNHVSRALARNSYAASFWSMPRAARRLTISPITIRKPLIRDRSLAIFTSCRQFFRRFANLSIITCRTSPSVSTNARPARPATLANSSPDIGAPSRTR